MWKPTPARTQSPATGTIFWWCRPFSQTQEPLGNMSRHQPLPAWRRRALLK